MEMISHSNRQSCNKSIITKLLALIEKYPDVRFTQLLFICNITSSINVGGHTYLHDNFNEESEVTLNKMCLPTDSD